MQDAQETGAPFSPAVLKPHFMERFSPWTLHMIFLYFFSLGPLLSSGPSSGTAFTFLFSRLLAGERECCTLFFFFLSVAGTEDFTGISLISTLISILGCGQVARRRNLDPTIKGSNPFTPAHRICLGSSVG